jgi:hypothetical protein
MAKKVSGVVVVTPKFRVSFPKVFKPEYNKMAKRDEYSVVALFEKGQDISVLKDAAMKVGKEAWGENVKKWPKNWKNPFKDQGEREKEIDGKNVLPDGYVKGAIMVQMKSKNKPGIIGRDKQPIDDPEKFYAGCWARANVFVSVFEVEDDGVVLNRGISISLNHLQKVADGEPFSGRRKAEECFEAIEDDDPNFPLGDSDEDEEENPFG